MELYMCAKSPVEHRWDLYHLAQMQLCFKCPIIKVKQRDVWFSNPEGALIKPQWSEIRVHWTFLLIVSYIFKLIVIWWEDWTGNTDVFSVMCLPYNLYGGHKGGMVIFIPKLLHMHIQVRVILLLWCRMLCCFVTIMQIVHAILGLVCAGRQAQ